MGTLLGAMFFCNEYTNNNTLPYHNQFNQTDICYNSSYSVNIINFSEKLKKNIDLINNLKEMPDNWNGYGANKLSDSVINSALSAIYFLDVQPDVFPTGRNSIQFEYEKSNGDYLEFEIFSDHITMLKIISDDETERNVASMNLNALVADFYA